MAEADLPTFQDLYDVGKTELLTRAQAAGFESVDLTEGSVSDRFLGAGAAIGDEVVRTLVQQKKKCFFSTATGTDLDELADDRLGISREDAAYAYGAVTVTNPGPEAVEVPAGSRFGTAVDADGHQVTFATQSGLTVAAGDSEGVGVVAEEVGTDGLVGVGTIVEVLDSDLQGLITVTNPEITVGTAPSDAVFLDFIRAAFPDVDKRAATEGGIEWGARRVAGVAYAKAIENLNEPGRVRLVVCDENGDSNGAMVQLVYTEVFIYWRALGIPLDVQGATKLTPTVAFTIAVPDTKNQPAVQAGAAAAVLRVLNLLEPEETLYRSSIVAAAKRVEHVVDVPLSSVVIDGASPPVDLEPGAGEIIRGVLTNITVTVVDA